MQKYMREKQKSCGREKSLRVRVCASRREASLRPAEESVAPSRCDTLTSWLCFVDAIATRLSRSDDGLVSVTLSGQSDR